jgi:hypothetical protein
MNKQEFDRLTYEVRKMHGVDEVNIYGWGTYEPHSVLAGQPKKVFIDTFDTLDDALRAFPDAQGGGKFTDPQVSLNHLPGEDDFVAGGAYPDDWD